MGVLLFSKCLVIYCLYFQLVLKCSSGIDYAEFYKFIQVIAERRISCLTNTLNCSRPGAVNETVCDKQDRRENDTKSIVCDGSANDLLKKGVPRTEVYKNDENELMEKCNDCANAKHGPGANLCDKVPYYYHVDRSHMIFDLYQVKCILSDMIQTPEFIELDEKVFDTLPSDLMKNISDLLSEIH